MRVSLAMLVALHISFALGYEVSIVHRDLHRGRTCDSSSQLSLRPNLFVHEIHRDPGTCSQLSLRSTNVLCDPRRTRLACSRASSRSVYSFVKAHESKHLFAIIVVIAQALPVQRDVCCDWTEQQLVMSCCTRLNDRSSMIKDMGQLEHSGAASFSRHHERNSASRGEFFFLNKLEERMWLEFTYLLYRLEEG